MLVTGLLIGVIATIGMDLWPLVVKHLFRLPTTDWAMIGRRVAFIPQGKYCHAPITASDEIRHELLIGWIVHYANGVVYGVLYLYIVQVILDAIPSFQSALLFGLATLIAPWFIMQPGLGMGAFASREPKPGLIRLINISMHLAFAVSLYLGWLFLGHVEAF